MRRSVKRGLMGAITLALVLGSVGLGAQGQGGTQGQGGFRAMTGPRAAAFAVPSDMRLVSRGPAGAGGQLVAERYRQYVGDVEVFGGELTVYADQAGRRRSVIGAHYPGLAPTNRLRITADSAQGVAAARRSLTGGTWRTDLLIHPETARYFYRVEFRGFDARWFYWVDAESGSVINEYDGLTTGSGTGVQGDTKDLNGLTSLASGTYRMVSGDGRQTTYDARNRNGLPGTLATDSDDQWNTLGSSSPGQPALVDAQFYANVTDSYYWTKYKFDWVKSYPQGMVSSAHVGRRYNNAYWNGTQMAYGDGDGSLFIELSGDLDVVGHELSHGVTEATSNLIYQNESGALNEAFSDIMGTAIEYYYGSGNWTIGEDVTPGTDGIRDMAEPNADGDPSHYADRYTGTGDNGGVHTNSGIVNHWFYLLVNGGQNANASRASGTNVQGIGLAAAEQVAYLGFTALTASANFCAARTSTITVAGNHAANVADAWDEVGVDDALCGGGSSTGDGIPPAITNVLSKKLKGGKFQITWTTDIPSNSVVTFTCCGSYTNSALVTSHKMQFNGSIGASYTFYVSSTDADGDEATAGPFTHQN